ncbi:MAG TPA: ABC transporter substrate-binding protein, partial [Clostridia bacterium]|nr:ABC transporter substrate-binding protein [Clostridia bacterium]
MKTLRKLTAALTALVLVFTVAGCGNDKTDPTTTQAPPSTTERQKTTINLAGLKGPTGMGLVQLMQADADGTTANDYNFTLEAAPTDIVPLITTQAVDIAACPLNLASTLYNKTNGGVQILCINTLGVLYILEQGDSVQSIADLKGKTIYSSGQGASPEYILNFLLTTNGMDPEKDVTIEYKAEHSELAALAATDKAGIYVLPEPFVSTVTGKNPQLKNVLNLTTEWEKACEISGTPSTLAMGCLVVRTEFAQNNPEAVSSFLK